MSRVHVLRRAAWLGCAALVATPAAAQERGARRAMVQAGVVMDSWSFATPLATDSGRVDRVSQTAFPVGLAIPLGSRWTADLSGAYAVGSARITDSTGANAGTLDLSGPTDVKLRLIGRLVGDAVVLNVGINAPTGLTQLEGEEVSALRLIGAPALRMPSPALGSGFGATAGLVVARQVGQWAVAAGGSYESRSSYSPVDAAIGGASAVTDLDPSNAVHLTLGADRLIGAHRLSLLSSYDVYGEDRLTLSAGGQTSNGTYQLGPSMTFMGLVELGVAGMQEMSVLVVDRYRSSFKGLDGATAPGSSGNTFETRVRARFGAPGRIGWLLGADARFDTGLEVDESLATAAMNAFGGTLGVSLPMGGVTIEPAVRAFLGNIDTGVQSSSATGLGFTVTLGRR